VPVKRFRAEHLRPHGWAPPQTLHIPDWGGCTTEYLPVPVGDGWWLMVPIWGTGLGGESAAAVRAARAGLTVMPLLRLPDPPDLVTATMTGKQTLYTVTLSAAPYARTHG
jgi:hypothetical protein